MKILNVLVLVGLCFSLNAFAGDQDEVKLDAFLSEQRIQFIYDGSERYHCDYVKAETSAMLRRLGARDVQVLCTGGIPSSSVNYVDARFISIRQTTSEKSTRKAILMPVSFKFRNSCNLHSRIMSEILTGFDIFDYVDAGDCSRTRGQSSYEMNTLF